MEQSGDNAEPVNDHVLIRARNRFDFGVRAGRAAGGGTLALVNALSRLSKRSERGREVAMAAKARFRQGKDERPESADELRGLALSLGLDAEDLAAARSLACSVMPTGCTNFGAMSPATDDGQTVVSWNFDVPCIFRLLMGRQPMFVRDIAGSIPYVCMGMPAFFGIGILNAEGLACAVNAVGITDKGPGLSPFELNNIAMETCADVSSAAAVFREGPRRILKALYAGVLFNWNTIWGDARGGLSVFECSHNHFHEERAGERASIASANHHQFLDRGLTGSVDPLSDPLIAGSYSRLARMYSLLDAYHGCINPFAAKLIVSDHIPDYSVLKEYGIEREWWEDKVDDSTICAHPWNMRRHLARGEVYPALEEATVSWTVYSFQVRPGSMTIWFTDGHPCRRPTTPYYWGGLLGSGGEPDPGAIDPGTGRALRRETARRGMFMRDTSGFPASVEKVIMGRIEAVESSHFEKHGPAPA